MQLRQLEYLCAVAESRHFGRAAEACHVSQPALSTSIRKLEEELGLELIRRGRRYDDLTAPGKELVTWARRALAASQTFTVEASRLRGELAGRLRLGVVPTALPVIAEIVGPVLQKHPSIDLELRSLSASEIAKQIETAAIDAGLTYLDGKLPSGLRAHPIFLERHAYLVGEAECPEGRAQIAWRELDGASLCLLTAEMHNRQLIDAALAVAETATEVRVETDSISGLLSLAHRGWATIVSEAWLSLYGVPEGTRALRLVEPDLSYPIGFVTPSSAHPSPLVSTLLQEAGTPPLLEPAPRASM